MTNGEYITRIVEQDEDFFISENVVGTVSIEVSLDWWNKPRESEEIDADKRMTKEKLMSYVGKKVHIYFKDGEKEIYGTLGYADEFSVKHDYRKPNYFYIGNTSFKVSHVRKLVESEE